MYQQSSRIFTVSNFRCFIVPNEELIPISTHFLFLETLALNPSLHLYLLFWTVNLHMAYSTYIVKPFHTYCDNILKIFTNS